MLRPVRYLAGLGSHHGGLATRVAAETFKVLSARGVHVYLQVTEPVTPCSVPKFFDIKSTGGYVLTAPSLHPSGHVYEAIDDDAPVCRVDSLASVFPFMPTQPTPQAAPTGARAAAPSPPPCQAAGVIERIKAQITCADLLGVDLAGREKVSVLCPLHPDDNPSAVVSTDGHFYCFAGCTGDRQYDVIDLYAALHHLPFRQAIAELARLLDL